MTGEGLLDFPECFLAKVKFDSDSDRKKNPELPPCLATIIADYEIYIFCVCSINLLFFSEFNYFDSSIHFNFVYIRCYLSVYHLEKTVNSKCIGNLIIIIFIVVTSMN